MNGLVTVLVAALLGLTGVAYALQGEKEGPTPEERRAEAGHAHAAPLAHDKEARLARAEAGRVPTLLDLASLERHGAVAFVDDSPWTPAQGVLSGSGAAGDPYVIDGIHADLVYIADTNVDFEIRNSWIGRLILDWHGDNGLVHHNRIQAFQVNRNVERTGGPSAAVIAHNEIDEFTQLRHFDGVVTKNVIGRAETNVLDRGVAWDVAGFNGAVLADNLVYGGVDVKLHGHHHDDGAGGSHNHGAPDAEQAGTHAAGHGDRDEDHADRHHRLVFANNTVVDPLGFGLRYNDRAHAGDDRQANSEQEPALERPHRHFTHVAIVDNVVDGAPLRVEIFMARDELHDGGNGELLLARNRVVNATVKDAIFVAAVDEAHVIVEDNVLSKAVGLGTSTGIRAASFRNSTLVVRGNVVDGFGVGVRAEDFDAGTRWWVEGNRVTGAAHEVYWDESVANPPEGSAGHGGHRHEEGAPEAVLRRMRGLL